MINFTFHHIGIAVFSIEKSSEFYVNQGYEITETVFDPIQNVNICFINCKKNRGGYTCIELISPKDETSPVNKNLQKNGVSPYHICYEVENIEEAILELKKQKFILVSKPQVAVAMNNKKVCFLFNKNTGLIELVEK